MFLRQTAADKVTALYAARPSPPRCSPASGAGAASTSSSSMTDAVVSFLWADAAANEVLLESDGVAALELRRRLPADALRRRVGHRHADVGRTTSPACAGRSASTAGTTPASRRSRERIQHRELLAEIMDLCYASAANLTMAEATERLEAERVPFAMILSPEELTRDPHAVAIGLFEEPDHHVVGPHPPAAPPDAVRRHPRRAHAAARRRSGEHTDEILAELGLGDRIADLRERARRRLTRLEARFLEGSIHFPDYPYAPASVSPTGAVRVADVSPTPTRARLPPEVRLHTGETLFVSGRSTASSAASATSTGSHSAPAPTCGTRRSSRSSTPSSRRATTSGRPRCWRGSGSTSTRPRASGRGSARRWWRTTSGPGSGTGCTSA